MNHLIYKTKYSDCFKKYKNTKDKLEYINYLNTELDLKEPFVLSSSEIEFNKSKRTFFKVMANSLFGKLEQKTNKSQTLFVSNQKDLEEIFFSENKINDIFCINENICEVQISPNELKLRPNRKSNCYIGAQVTAYARETIYKHIQTLLKVNAFLYRVDCDSIIFTLPKSIDLPFKFSDAVGHFKMEVDGNIESFYSLGPKNYSLTFELNGHHETISKVSGLSITNSLQKDLLSDKLFEFYIAQFLKKNSEKTLVKQQRIKGNFKKLKISSSIENITFSNDISKRRYVLPNTLNYQTNPYGFNSN
jgi:hypothetical protein